MVGGSGLRGARSGASLAHALTWFAASYGVAVVGYLLVNALVGRLAGLDGFGTYLLLVGAATLLSQLGLLGVHRSGLREAARLAPLDGTSGTTDDTATLADLRDDVAAVSLIALPALAVPTGLVTWVLLGRDADSIVPAALTALLVVLTGQQRVYANFLRGLGRVRFAALLEGRSGGALTALAQASAVGLVWLLRPGLGLDGALAATAVGYLVALAPAHLLLRRIWGPLRLPHAPGRVLRRVVRRDWRFALTQAGGQANAVVDQAVAVALLPAASASLFGAAMRLAQLVLVPSTSLATVFSPAVSRLHHAGDRSGMERLLRTGTTIALAGSALLALPLLVTGAPVLRLVFPDGFGAAALPLAVLTAGYLLNAVSGMSGVTLSMSHHEGAVALVQWGGLGCRLLLGSLGATFAGLLGLAVGSAVATSLVYAAMWWQARRLLGVRTHATVAPRPRLLTTVRG